MVETYQNMILSKDHLHTIAKSISSDRDREFFLRVFNTPREAYIGRLHNIGFVNKSDVLDAGCGFGQWSVVLASLNKRVHSIELDSNRLQIAESVAKKKGFKNIDFIHRDIENLQFNDDAFDAIFCYSVIYYTNFKNTLKEFYRVLKPGGKLYFSTNGLGWYIYNIINQPYRTTDFDPRCMAIEAVKNSLDFYNNNNSMPNGKSIIMPRNIVINNLASIGFVDILSGEEGKIVTIPDGDSSLSFFNGYYYGHEGAYEILCKKSK